MERQTIANTQTTSTNERQRQLAQSSSGLSLLGVQRSIGNRAVQRLINSPYIQAKLQVSAPEDPSEQEADRVAENVMRMSEPTVSRQAQPLSSQITPLAQRDTDQIDEDEQIVARKSKSRIPVAVREDEEETSVQRVCDECEDEMAHRAEGDDEEAIQRDHVTGTPGQIQNSTAQSIRALNGHGSPLPAATRSFFEPRLGADFSQVRVHTDLRASETARSINAKAFTVGPNIAFASGRYAPQSHEGQQLLAHELTHVIQQRAGATVVHRDPDDPAADKPNPPSTLDIPIIPPSWVQQPKRSDVLVVHSPVDKKMVALPAQGAFVLIRPPTAEIPKPGATPVVSIPTVGKESVKMVKVANQTGFMIDAGGQSGVLFPGAFAIMTQSLGVSSVRGLVITHLHEDHVQSLVEIVRNNQIRPENIHFPEAFAVNRNAPSSVFANVLNQLKTDPSLQGFGHGTSANYGVIRTPSQGNWWRTEVKVGEVTFEMYGITAAFRELEVQRAAGQPQKGGTVGTQKVPSIADTASLVTRVTHDRTGFRMLFISDPRFQDLRLLKTAMGPAYGEMLTGVHVVEGLGHHLGALENRANVTAFAEFLKDAQLRSGRLVVLAQSQETYKGKQYLNRSLIAALTEAGVEVHVALEPRAGAVGTFTVDTEGRVTYTGGGRQESFMSSAATRAEISRLHQLRQVEETLTLYERFAEPTYQRSNDFRQARERLEGVLSGLMDTTAENVQRGAAGRAQSTVRDPALQAQALTNAQATRSPVESLMTPEFLAAVQDLRRTGPYYLIFEREATEARKTGRLSDKGINALWEIAPEIARKLLGTTGMSRRQREEALRYVPGQPAPLRIRSAAAVLLIVEAANLAAPIVEQMRRTSFDEDVKPALEDIMWWQDKGVFPAMQAVDDNLWPWSNEWTTNPRRIVELLNDNEVSYLALTGIPENGNWDRFTIWASAKLKNYRDWARHITDTKAIRASGTYMGKQTFEYRTSQVHGTSTGHDVEVTWQHSERLDKILNAAAEDVVQISEEQIESRAVETGAVAETDMVRPEGSSSGIFEGLAKAGGRMRFKPGVDPVLYTLHEQRKRTGYATESVFYTFEKVPFEGSVFNKPNGYVIVGGADFNTYSRIYHTKNLIRIKGYDIHGNYGPLNQDVQPNTYEVLLARKADLVEDK